MKTTVAVKIFNKTIAIIIKLSAVLKVFICALSKIICIHKVVSCIVWRVYINHFYLAEVCLLQKFQHFKVIALDIEVFGIVKVNAFLSARAEGFVYRCIGKL